MRISDWSSDVCSSYLAESEIGRISQTMCGRHMSLGRWRHWLKMRVRLAAVRTALKRPAPKTIPVTGPRQKQRNYSAVYLRAEEARYYVDNACPQGLEGAWFNPADRAGWPASVPCSTIPQFELEIYRYSKEDQFTYRSAAKFLLHHY